VPIARAAPLKDGSKSRWFILRAELAVDA